MVAITKTESEIIRKHFPNVHIVRTMKQKSKRHHYFCEESRAVMKFLTSLREDNVDTKTTREGANHTDRKSKKRVTT